MKGMGQKAWAAEKTLVSTVHTCTRFSWNFKYLLYFLQMATLLLRHHRLIAMDDSIFQSTLMYSVRCKPHQTPHTESQARADHSTYIQTCCGSPSLLATAM